MEMWNVPVKCPRCGKAMGNMVNLGDEGLLLYRAIKTPEGEFVCVDCRAKEKTEEMWKTFDERTKEMEPARKSAIRKSMETMIETLISSEEPVSGTKAETETYALPEGVDPVEFLRSKFPGAIIVQSHTEKDCAVCPPEKKFSCKTWQKSQKDC